MFGFLVSVTTISGGVVSVSGSGVSVGRGVVDGVVDGMVDGGGVVGGSLVVGTIAGGGVGWQSSHEGEESQNSECLKDLKCLKNGTLDGFGIVWNVLEQIAKTLF